MLDHNIEKFHVISSEGVDPPPGHEPLALFNPDGSPYSPGGGSFAPYDITVIGSAACPLLDGWTDAVADDGEPQPVIYKQCGRVWMTGVLVAPGGNQIPFNIPEGFGFVVPTRPGGNPGPLGGDPEVVGAVDMSWVVPKNWDTPLIAEISNSDPICLLFTTAPLSGDYVNLDGISWPLAAA